MTDRHSGISTLGAHRCDHHVYVKNLVRLHGGSFDRLSWKHNHTLPPCELCQHISIAVVVYLWQASRNRRCNVLDQQKTNTIACSTRQWTLSVDLTGNVKKGVCIRSIGSSKPKRELPSFGSLHAPASPTGSQSGLGLGVWSRVYSSTVPNFPRFDGGTALYPRGTY